MLYSYLEATGFTEGQLPATLSVHIARGPTLVRPADARRRVVSEHVECSSGGYRFKRHQEEYEVETSEPAWQAAQAAAANPARAEPGVAGVAGVPGPAGGGAADKLGV